MYDYIKGEIVELNPAEAVIECHGIGFDILISLQTYEELQGKAESKLYIYHHLREDDEQFYGFATKDERELFKLLISVSGVGVGSARVMLSSLSSDEIRNAIISEDVRVIKSVKGIGLKTAQRLILELKDKIIKGAGAEVSNVLGSQNTEIIAEATTALITLGFAKGNVEKALSEIVKSNPAIKVEDLIKEALKRL